MMVRYEQEVHFGHPLSRGWPRPVESEQEQALIQLCLRRQAERKLATVEDAIDYLRGTGNEVDRFWVKRLAEGITGKLALRQAVFFKEARCNVSPNNIKACFDLCRTQLAAVPSPSWRTQMTPEWEPKETTARQRNRVRTDWPMAHHSAGNPY
jgi:hypothetical protein